MKPPGFSYHRPETVEEALEVLDEVAPEGKVLAGGQSLVPLLNMRLTAPEHLVDINRLGDLGYVGVRQDGAGRAVDVGATARHADVERDPDAYAALPLLRQAVRHVAHPTIRNRGTTVGSLVHADPSGEMTAVLALLGGSVRVRSARGERTIAAGTFFYGPLESSVAPDELAVSATFPVPAGRTSSAWLETARRNGDYAICGVGALVTLDDDLRVACARAGYISVGPVPVVLDLTEAVGTVPFDAADWATAGRYAADQLRPGDDIHATAPYRRHLAGVLTERALRAAIANTAAPLSGRDRTEEGNT